MGMDVFGKKPRTEVGEYFRNNVWYWHPLWDYCCAISPELTEKVLDGHSNSGDGLNSHDSRELSKLLKESIENGTANKYISEFNSKKDSAELEDCYCVQHQNSVYKDCKNCNGTGKMKSFSTWYSIDSDNISNFADFLEYCGGFSIC